MIVETQLPIIIVSVVIVGVVLTLVLFSYRLLGLPLTVSLSCFDWQRFYHKAFYTHWIFTFVKYMAATSNDGEM